MKNKSQPRYVLVAGPLPIKGDVIGGTKVSFDILVNALKLSDEFVPIVHNTSRKLQGVSKFKRLFLNFNGIISLSFFLICNRAKSNNFMWNVSSHGLISSGFIVWIITKLLGYKVILRVFGGDLADVLANQSGIKKIISEQTFMSFTNILVQSKSLVQELASFKNVHWFPTTRTVKSNVNTKQSSCLNFIYVGQLKVDKGLDLVCEVLESGELEGINMTVCGPEVSEGLSERLKACGAKVLGQLPFEEIELHIAKSDAFVFPTRYSGEGYPGAVIEALQSAVPVITTDWKYMTEIVEDRKSGLVIESSRQCLLNAMKELLSDHDLFVKLSNGAKIRGKEFETITALTKLEKLIK